MPIDQEEILAGDDIFEQVGIGLKSMDVLVFLVSKQSLRSSWVDREVKFAALQEIKQKRVLILHIVTVTELLGHSSIGVTMRYCTCRALFTGV